MGNDETNTVDNGIIKKKNHKAKLLIMIFLHFYMAKKDNFKTVGTKTS